MLNLILSSSSLCKQAILLFQIVFIEVIYFVALYYPFNSNKWYREQVEERTCKELCGMVQQLLQLNYLGPLVGSRVLSTKYIEELTLG